MNVVSGIKSFSGADAVNAKAWFPVWLWGWREPFMVTEDELNALNADGRALCRGRLIFNAIPQLIEV